MTEAEEEATLAKRLREVTARLIKEDAVYSLDARVLNDAAAMIEAFDKERQRLNYAIDMAPG